MLQPRHKPKRILEEVLETVVALCPAVTWVIQTGVAMVLGEVALEVP